MVVDEQLRTSLSLWLRIDCSTQKLSTMKATFLLLFMTQILFGVLYAQDPGFKPAKVSFDDYKFLVSVVESHRSERLVDLHTFLEMSKMENVVILDSRTYARYLSRRIKGAKHLAFTDFTQESLMSLIPDPTTTILIYCNNNFEGDEINFASKVSLPRQVSEVAESTTQEEPMMMALNIPTYINLYGYGYRNIYELSELVNIHDSRIQFEGHAVGIVLPEPVVVKVD